MFSCLPCHNRKQNKSVPRYDVQSKSLPSLTLRTYTTSVPDDSIYETPTLPYKALQKHFREKNQPVPLCYQQRQSLPHVSVTPPPDSPTSEENDEPPPKPLRGIPRKQPLQQQLLSDRKKTHEKVPRFFYPKTVIEVVDPIYATIDDRTDIVTDV